MLRVKHSPAFYFFVRIMLQLKISKKKKKKNVCKAAKVTQLSQKKNLDRKQGFQNKCSDKLPFLGMFEVIGFGCNPLPWLNVGDVCFQVETLNFFMLQLCVCKFRHRNHRDVSWSRSKNPMLSSLQMLKMLSITNQCFYPSKCWKRSLDPSSVAPSSCLNM